MTFKKIIYGCEERGDAHKPYLTRYTLIDTKHFQLCLHVFHRSDADDHHDHPWNFISLILWRGYFEETPEWPICPKCDNSMSLDGKNYHCVLCRLDYLKIPFGFEKRIRVRRWPLDILFRKANHRHRVHLVNHKKCVSLVLMGKRKREWGFYTRTGWLHWVDYFIKNKC